MAFDAAADHVHRLHIPITCYIMEMPHYRRTCSEQLVRQTQMLERLAEQGTINEGTMNRALAAIERDITFLNPYQKTIQLTDDLFHVREWTSLPEYRELDIAITPAAAEATRYLVQLLVEGP